MPPKQFALSHQVSVEIWKKNNYYKKIMNKEKKINFSQL